MSHGEGASIEARSMSEYLIETLPGWHGEEFVDPSASNYGFFYEVCNPKTVHKLCIESFEDSKMGFVIWWQGYDSGTCTLPFMAHDSDNNGDLGNLWPDDLGILVNPSSAMDHQISRSMRVFSNKDQQTFNSSSIKRPRQLW